MHLDENQEDKLVLSRMLQEGLYTKVAAIRNPLGLTKR